MNCDIPAFPFPLLLSLLFAFLGKVLYFTLSVFFCWKRFSTSSTTSQRHLLSFALKSFKTPPPPFVLLIPLLDHFRLHRKLLFWTWFHPRFRFIFPLHTISRVWKSRPNIPSSENRVQSYLFCTSWRSNTNPILLKIARIKICFFPEVASTGFRINFFPLLHIFPASKPPLTPRSTTLPFYGPFVRLVFLLSSWVMAPHF